MIKAVFFDIDGTLVPFGEKRMPKSIVEGLDKLRSNGVKVFIATGRSPGNLKSLQSILDYDFDGFIAMNGQYCFTKDLVIREKCFDTESFPMLMKYLEENDVSCSFVEINYVYINRISERVMNIRRSLGASVIYEPIDKPERALTHKIYQLSAYTDQEQEKELVRHFPGSKAVRWSPVFADIIPEDGGKDVGISKVIEHFGIKREETMAFGDGGNDMDMLKYCNIGVAMGNAGDEVKAIANHVTDNTDKDGIYKALKYFELI